MLWESENDEVLDGWGVSGISEEACLRLRCVTLKRVKGLCDTVWHYVY